MKKYKKLIWIFVVIVVIVLTFLFVSNRNGDYQTINVTRQDFVERVEISGKVVPSQEVDLSFELVGKISRINVDIGDSVRKGDILAELDTSEINSEISEVYYSLEKEKALLSEASGDSTLQSRLENQSQNLISTIKKTYINSDDIIKNTVDVFFDNPNYRFPEFTVALSNYFLRKDINNKRVEIGKMLVDWKSKIDLLTTNTINNQDALLAINNLKAIESFLALISSEVDDYNPTGSVSQTQIDSYITSISNARQAIASLIVETNSVYNEYRSVLADIPVLQSNVNNAEATVQKLSARKDKYFLRSPFDGVVTDKTIESGQVVSAGQNVMSMITNNSFEVEGYIPELNIIGLDVGDKAELTFDAFGPDVVFDAIVSHVDPRETLKDGITTYKINLNFDEINTNIRSGMTNDIKIIKDFISNQIVIPKYLVNRDDAGNYVQILESGNKVKKYIEIGKSDGAGGVIVLSGLNEGELLIKE